MKRRWLTLLLVPALLLGAAGCTSTPPAPSGQARVVTSFYPLYIFTKNLTQGIDGLSVSNMTEQNAGCLHDYQLLSKDMKTLSRASLFIANGAGMESFLEKITQQLPALPVVTASDGVALLEPEEPHEGDGHDHEENGHVWLSVQNAMRQVRVISGALCLQFPAYTRQIEENQINYLARLQRLDGQIRAGLRGFSGAEIISFHEAYDYFAEDYGLKIAASIESDSGGEPGTQELVRLTQLIRDEGIRALFIEPNYQGSAAKLLCVETGAAIFTLNPVTSGPDSMTAYEEIMLQNMKEIQEALS